MDIIRKTQMAAQIVALMQADFSRPGDADMESILDIARWQIRDLRQLKEMKEAQEQSSSVHRCSTQ